MLKLKWIRKFDNNFDPPYANCWALTMLIYGGLKAPKWVTADEIEQWLADNTVDAIGEPRSGDILVMRSKYNYSRENCIEHTAIYMGNGDYWHKPGNDVGQYTTLAFMQRLYAGATIQYHVRVKTAQDMDTAQKINEQIKALVNKAA